MARRRRRAAAVSSRLLRSCGVLCAIVVAFFCVASVFLPSLGDFFVVVPVVGSIRAAAGTRAMTIRVLSPTTRFVARVITPSRRPCRLLLS